MLKHNEVNPLAVFGLRMMEHCPPHFTTIEYNSHASEKVITDWIWEHLDGRFYIGDIYIDTPGASIAMKKMVGFELPGEASYFSLILDTIDKNPNELEW